MRRMRYQPARRPNPLKRLLLFLLPVLLIGGVGFFLINNFILPANKYKTAMGYLESGEFAEAKILLGELGDYKDAAEKFALFSLMHPAEGDLIYFGQYEQDGNPGNGPEAIAWRVLRLEGERGLLLARDNLDCQPFHTSWTEATWENSTLRRWLAENFILAAFTPAEQEALMATELTTPGNPETGVADQKTQDKAFLLSLQEATTYLPGLAQRLAENTAYANAQGAQADDNGRGNWWLRSSGSSATRAAEVYGDGSLVAHGYYVDYAGNGVRPAIWVNLQAPSYLATAKPQQQAN